MDILNNKSLIDDMNLMGKNREPFLFILDFSINDPVLLPLNKAAKHDIWYFMTGNTNYSNNYQKTTEVKFTKNPVDYEVFKQAFNQVMKNIEYGNSFLTNLTFPTDIESNLTLEEIFERSDAPYRLLYKDKFVVFSPELFVRICGNQIAAFPMKGTINAAIPDASNKILNDPKETAEHHTIVDLIRNDLSMVASDVQVKRFRYIDEIIAHEKKLLQVSSEITGTLPDNYYEHLGEIICKLLPAGSISGAPKCKTLQIINEVETYKRGYYTGVFGIFDGEDMESAVMIRFIENIAGKMVYKSGGGITVFSNPVDEYNEMIDKVYVPIN